MLVAAGHFRQPRNQTLGDGNRRRPSQPRLIVHVSYEYRVVRITHADYNKIDPETVRWMSDR